MNTIATNNDLQFDVTLEASNVFCTKDGVVLQLWVDAHSRTPHEWRPLPSFEEAVAKYGCEKIASV